VNGYESDIGNFEARMKQHSANRFLLVTTSTVSETVRNQLVAVSKDESSSRKATYWAKSDLIAALERHPDLLSKYFRSWQSEADEAVEFIHAHLFPAHRGALMWCPGVAAIFGNRGYEDPCAKAEVERLRSELSNRRIEQLAFATDNYSWAVLVRHEDAHTLNDLVWQCSYVSEDDPAYTYERREGFTRLYSYFHTPHKPRCPL
jgi:hypothetical protein